MAHEDLNTLGFETLQDGAPLTSSFEQNTGGKANTSGGDMKSEFIAGLSSAKKGKGGLFGISLPFSGYIAPAPTGAGLGGHKGGGR